MIKIRGHHQRVHFGGGEHDAILVYLADKIEPLPVAPAGPSRDYR